MKGGLSLLISSSGRMWLGSTVLAGLMLAGSLSVPAAGKIAAKTTLISIPTGPYTNIVRTQLQWRTASLTSSQDSNDSTPVLSASSTPNNVTKSADKLQSRVVPVPAERSKAIQVAAASQKQVSRSVTSQLINNALSLQGVPYRFGGTSRNGFDCSGFTQYVYRASNTSLPRTAAEQFRTGTGISRGQLQAGDLVFFSTYASGASHVGIYIGGGRFVHASNKGIRVTSLSDNYYASRYLGARRIN